LKTIFTLGFWIGLLSLVAGCGDTQAGTSTQTENHLGMRTIRIDSILPMDNPCPVGATVSTLRFDFANFAFSEADSSGKSLAIERLDGSPVPFQIVFWDARSAVGRLKVRIDSALRSSHSSLVLRWNLPLANRSDSGAVWQGFSPAQTLFLNSVLVDDFEDGVLRNDLPDSSAWTDTASANASFSNFDVRPATDGRSGKALHFTYSADSATNQYVLIKTPLASSSRCLRSLDSIVLWMRGSGKLYVALENTSGGVSKKAWATYRVDSSQWNRIRVRPQDFAAAENKYGNVGWSSVRDSITHITFLMAGSGDFWLDDVRIHGIDRDDLR